MCRREASSGGGAARLWHSWMQEAAVGTCIRTYSDQSCSHWPVEFKHIRCVESSAVKPILYHGKVQDADSIVWTHAALGCQIITKVFEPFSTFFCTPTCPISLSRSKQLQFLWAAWLMNCNAKSPVQLAILCCWDMFPNIRHSMAPLQASICSQQKSNASCAPPDPNCSKCSNSNICEEIICSIR